MIPPGFTWNTKDRRKLDIRWMDSVHLAHSFNMMCRENSLTIKSFANGAPATAHGILRNIAHELKARGHFEWIEGSHATTLGYDQVTVPKTRESLQVLCMFRALRDHNVSTEALRVMRGDTMVEWILAGGDAWEKIIATYTAYRLERS